MNNHQYELKKSYNRWFARKTIIRNQETILHIDCFII